MLTPQRPTLLSAFVKAFSASGSRILQTKLVDIVPPLSKSVRDICRVYLEGRSNVESSSTLSSLITAHYKSRASRIGRTAASTYITSISTPLFDSQNALHLCRRQSPRYRRQWLHRYLDRPEAARERILCQSCCPSTKQRKAPAESFQVLWKQARNGVRS